jgi:hypothetical protein
MDTDETVEFDTDGLHRIAYARTIERNGVIAADVNEGMILTHALIEAAK